MTELTIDMVESLSGKPSTRKGSDKPERAPGRSPSARGPEPESAAAPAEKAADRGGMPSILERILARDGSRRPREQGEADPRTRKAESSGPATAEQEGRSASDDARNPTGTGAPGSAGGSNGAGTPGSAGGPSSTSSPAGAPAQSATGSDSANEPADSSPIGDARSPANAADATSQGAAPMDPETAETPSGAPSSGDTAPSHAQNGPSRRGGGPSHAQNGSTRTQDDSARRSAEAACEDDELARCLRDCPSFVFHPAANGAWEAPSTAAGRSCRIRCTCRARGTALVDIDTGYRVRPRRIREANLFAMMANGILRLRGFERIDHGGAVRFGYETSCDDADQFSRRLMLALSCCDEAIRLFGLVSQGTSPHRASALFAGDQDELDDFDFDPAYSTDFDLRPERAGS